MNIIKCYVKHSLTFGFSDSASFAVSASILGFSVGANKAWCSVLLRKLVGVPNVASGQGIYLVVCGVGDLVAPIVAGVKINSAEI